MNPSKVDRARLQHLTDLPNVGPATAGDLRVLGYRKPDDLIGANPWSMYQQLCEVTGQRHDPCVIDVFMSITSFMDGEPSRPWWEFTESRKMRISTRLIK